MKRTSIRKRNLEEETLSPEYRFDYEKSKPNEFAAKMGRGVIVVAHEETAIRFGEGVSRESEQISRATLYEENAKVTAVFWEWRHKTMRNFLAMLGGLVGVTGALYAHFNGISRWHFVPLFAGAIYSSISYFLDKRHTTILRECYRIGANLELQAGNQPAIFFFIRNLHYTRGSLTQILHFGYLISALALLVLSFIVIFLA